MIKTIERNDIIYGKIIRANYQPTQTEFFTRKEDELQFGVMFFEQNHKTGTHYHNHTPNNTNQTDEILIIQEGSARVDFYDDTGSYIKSCEIFKGDIAIIYRGGHNILFYENTKVFTIKPGAYEQNDDKTRMVGTNNLELLIENN